MSYPRAPRHGRRSFGAPSVTRPLTMPISAPKVSLARVDALCVYTLVLAQCLALQVVKDAQTLTWHVTGAWRALPTVALALAVLRAHARPGPNVSRPSGYSG